ncbi:MAG TPA: type IV pili twitching motility protein PilT, partial [Gammaproteobacteria bacterium]|nr:type IV pili twitching motility protein PilT [Gammaproteobacteria bacterium]
RIVNFFPPERHNQLFMDLSLNMRAVIAQQLIPTPDGRGRVPAVEVLIGTPLIQDKIREGAVHEIKEIMKRSREQHMQTFDQHLYELYVAGQITYEDALRYADSANEVRLMAKLNADDNLERMESATDGLSLLDDGGPKGPRRI